ncbi:hypothetical protein [macacine gammaherpesvirus 13]|uniref:EBNA-3B n=1 Tax=macacine gammaherpesvirus 13 TaxID=2341050 RepID=A0A3G1T4E6_9GAMA|nr:hypothetical protein QKT43_gp36 [Macaca arctoides gammaherpesvirus 1]AYA49821.1 hypothetical protein [Macaca arctoides gammaherpesvirus 1]
MKKAGSGRTKRDGAAETVDSSDNEDGGNMGEVGATSCTPETGSRAPDTTGEDITRHEPMENEPADGTNTEETIANPDHDRRTDPSPIWSSRHHVFTNVHPVQAPVNQVVYAAYDSMLHPSLRPLGSLFFEPNLSTEEFIWMCLTVRHRIRLVKERASPVAEQRAWKLLPRARTWPMGFRTHQLSIDTFVPGGDAAHPGSLTAIFACEEGARHRNTFSAGIVTVPKMPEFLQKVESAILAASYARSHSAQRYQFFFDLVSSGNSLFTIWLGVHQSSRVQFVEFVGWLAKKDHPDIHYWFSQCTGRRFVTKPWLRAHPVSVPYHEPLTSDELAMAYARGLNMDPWAVRLPGDPIIVDDDEEESDEGNTDSDEEEVQSTSNVPYALSYDPPIHGRPWAFRKRQDGKPAKQSRAKVADHTVLQMIEEEHKKRTGTRGRPKAKITTPAARPVPSPQVPTVVLHRPPVQPSEPAEAPIIQPLPPAQQPLPRQQVTTVMLHQPPAQVQHAPGSLLALLEKDDEALEQEVLASLLPPGPPPPQAVRRAPCVYTDDLNIEEDEPPGPSDHQQPLPDPRREPDAFQMLGGPTARPLAQEPQSRPTPQLQPPMAPTPQLQPQIALTPEPRRARPILRQLLTGPFRRGQPPHRISGSLFGPRDGSYQPVLPGPAQPPKVVRAPVFFPPVLPPRPVMWQLGSDTAVPSSSVIEAFSGGSGKGVPQDPTPSPTPDIPPPKRAKTEASLEPGAPRGEPSLSFAVNWENLSQGLQQALDRGDTDGAKTGAEGSAASPSCSETSEDEC